MYLCKKQKVEKPLNDSTFWKEKDFFLVPASSALVCRNRLPSDKRMNGQLTLIKHLPFPMIIFSTSRYKRVSVLHMANISYNIGKELNLSIQSRTTLLFSLYFFKRFFCINFGMWFYRLLLFIYPTHPLSTIIIIKAFRRVWFWSYFFLYFFPRINFIFILSNCYVNDNLLL